MFISGGHTADSTQQQLLSQTATEARCSWAAPQVLLVSPRTKSIQDVTRIVHLRCDVLLCKCTVHRALGCSPHAFKPPVVQPQ
jgi:hypothetical protein